MATTTVRLDDDDEDALDRLAGEFGGRSNAIRQALRQLAAQVARRDALNAFLGAWEREAGPVDEQRVAEAAQRFGL